RAWVGSAWFFRFLPLSTIEKAHPPAQNPALRYETNRLHTGRVRGVSENEQLPTTTDEAKELAASAADELLARTGADSFDALVVLGSGWAGAAETLGSPDIEFDATELTGFFAPTAEGHTSQVRRVRPLVTYRCRKLLRPGGPRFRVGRRGGATAVPGHLVRGDGTHRFLRSDRGGPHQPGPQRMGGRQTRDRVPGAHPPVREPHP